MSARNPYLDIELEQLAAAAGTRAAELRDRRVRTPFFSDGPYPLVFLQLPHIYFLVAASERGLPDHQAPVRLRPGSTVRVSHIDKFADWYSEILRSKVAPGLDYWRQRADAKKR